MTEQDDRSKLPREDQPDGWQYRRPGDQVKEPPSEPVPADGDSGSLDLPDTDDPVFEPAFEPSF